MIYFFSDVHLGLPNYQESLQRERKIVKWLDTIKHNATEIYMLGDVFEFWWEWKSVVPKYFVRFLGKLAELSDMGIKIHYFNGNHDIWAYDYFKKELNIEMYHEPQIKFINNKKFYLAHGDGLGPGDKSYKFMKRIFTNNFLQWIASNLFHPEAIFKLARKVSYKREALKKNPKFKQHEEWLVLHSQNMNVDENFDYFVYGHRHIPFTHDITEKSKVVVLGDWLVNFTYAVFDGKELKLLKFNE